MLRCVATPCCARSFIRWWHGCFHGNGEAAHVRLDPTIPYLHRANTQGNRPIFARSHSEGFRQNPPHKEGMETACPVDVYLSPVRKKGIPFYYRKINCHCGIRGKFRIYRNQWYSTPVARHLVERNTLTQAKLKAAHSTEINWIDGETKIAELKKISLQKLVDAFEIGREWPNHYSDEVWPHIFLCSLVWNWQQYPSPQYLLGSLILCNTSRYVIYYENILWSLTHCVIKYMPKKRISHMHDNDNIHVLVPFKHSMITIGYIKALC